MKSSLQALKRSIYKVRGWKHRSQRYWSEGLRTFRLKGRLYRSDQTLQILAQGSEDTAVSLSSLLFEEKPSFEALPSDTPWQASPTDDALVRLASPFSRAGPGEWDLCFWLDTQMPTVDPEVALAKSSKDFRRAVRQVTEMKPDVRFTEDLRDWEEWYHTMLVPMAASRHREKAKTPPLQELFSYAGRATLALVTIGGIAAAGCLLLPVRLTDTGRLWRIGMRPEFVENTKLYKGLNVYLDYLALEGTARLGCSTFSLGLALARVDEGLYRYKTNWGCSLVREPYGLLHRLSFPSTEKQLKILQKVPLFTLEKGQEVVLQMAAAEATAEHIERIRFPALKKIYLHGEGEIPPPIEGLSFKPIKS